MPKLTEVAQDSPVLQQILAAGIYRYLQDCDISEDGTSVDGIAAVGLVEVLRGDTRFLTGPGAALHPEIGKPRRDFRSLQNKFGTGSLQVVVNPITLKVHCDVDGDNPYHDLVRFFRHNWTVLRNRFRRTPKRGDRA